MQGRAWLEQNPYRVFSHPLDSAHIHASVFRGLRQITGDTKIKIDSLQAAQYLRTLKHPVGAQVVRQ